MNHVTYADDLCDFSPSVSGLRKLTDCCAKYVDMFDITYNANKSFYMVINDHHFITSSLISSHHSFHHLFSTDCEVVHVSSGVTNI